LHFTFRKTGLTVFAVVFSLVLGSLQAQDVTKVRGKVYDVNTGEVIPFATVSFKGTSIGVTTEDDGSYSIDTRFATDTLECSFLGYKVMRKVVRPFEKQTINFAMQDESLKLNTVDIIGKKAKYSKKNNPALELAKKITKNKDKNRLKGLDYYQYDQYERVSLDLNNITEDFKNQFIIRDFDWIWEYMDTSEVNGKTYLPVFLREIIGTKYFKKDGNEEKEYRKAMRYSNLSDRLDVGSLNDGLDLLYNEIDIYSDEIPLLEAQFVSPLSGAGPNFYRYYIIDTLIDRGMEVINLAFIPAVKGNLGFVGNIFVSNDDRYTVMKVDMGIVKDINLNFIRDLKIVQEFEQLGDNFIKTKDKVVVDYSLTENSLGAFGSREVEYSNYSFERPKDMSIFASLEKVINNPNGLIQPPSYWENEPLYNPSIQNLRTYEMADRLRADPRYRTYLAIGRAIGAGFIKTGPFDVGPIATFISFNDVEGLNSRFGGETNFDFSKKVKIQAYGAYAQRTKEWKYSTGITYTFNKDFITNPRHFVQFTAERESIFPGQDLEFFNPNNFLLSFQRGRTTNMLLDRTLHGRYRNEQNGYAFEVGARHKKRMPYGTLAFSIDDSIEGQPLTLDYISTIESYIGLRYAPNEQFIQGQAKRTQLYNEFPIINLNFAHGRASVGSNDINYSRLSLNIFKQIEWTTIGTTDIIMDAGKTWGRLPYLLQFIPRGNQTYAYQLGSFNMMNFLEFANDQFVSLKFEHFFYGYFLNRLPLIKRLKLREVISFKGLYGALSDANNPNFNPDMIQFSNDENGVPTTYVMDGDPYIEASIGLTNIFKFLRLDVVKRFTYLDQPNLPELWGQKGMGIRATFLVEF
jgi:hypothetical protein